MLFNGRSAEQSRYIRHENFNAIGTFAKKMPAFLAALLFGASVFCHKLSKN
jgi:hypothetical protein